MRAEEMQIARELINALGVLGKAQELRADDDTLSELVGRIRIAESEFRVLSGQSR